MKILHAPVLAVALMMCLPACTQTGVIQSREDGEEPPAKKTVLAPYSGPATSLGSDDAPDYSSSPNVTIVATRGGTAETSVAVSPVDPDRVVMAGSARTSGLRRRSEVYYSTNGGINWSAPAAMPADIDGKRFVGGGDPVVTVDGQGRFYLASLLVGLAPSMSGVAVMRSDDGGVTWNKPSIVSLHTGDVRGYDDKEWIVADDTGGPYDGNLYLIWGKYAVQYQPQPGQIMFSRSTDHGMTWSEPIGLSGVGGVGLSELEVGANGEVYASYSESGSPGFLLRRSFDGGVTFDEPRLITPFNGAFGTVPNTQMTYRPMQSFAVDRSKGPHRGTLYYLIPSHTIGTGGARVSAIGLTRSSDRGLSWTPLVNISGDTRGHDAMLPSIAVDGDTGDVVAAWIDRRDDPANALARLYASRSSDGGATWSTPRAFSAAFSIDATFVGDYNAVGAHAGRWVAGFSDASGYMSAGRIDLGQSPPTRRRSIRR